MNTSVIYGAARSALLICLIMVHVAVSAQTAFTYQGRLTTGGQPAQDAHDIEFRLFDAATNGNQVGSTLTENGLTVTDGVFSAVLDFGDGPFNSAPRWLQIDVREAGGGAFATLLPRQRVGASPFAIETLFVTPGAVDTAALQDGAVTDAKLADEAVVLGKLATGSVTSSAILNGQVSSADVANGTIARVDLADDLIGSSQIENDTVASIDIRDGTITAADISGGVLLSDKTALYRTTSDPVNVAGQAAVEATASCLDANDIPISFECEVLTTLHNIEIRETFTEHWTHNSMAATAVCGFRNNSQSLGADVVTSMICLAKP